MSTACGICTTSVGSDYKISAGTKLVWQCDDPVGLLQYRYWSTDKYVEAVIYKNSYGSTLENNVFGEAQLSGAEYTLTVGCRRTFFSCDSYVEFWKSEETLPSPKPSPSPTPNPFPTPSPTPPHVEDNSSTIQKFFSSLGSSGLNIFLTCLVSVSAVVFISVLVARVVKFVRNRKTGEKQPLLDS